MTASAQAISWTTEELAKVTDPAEVAVLEHLLAAHEKVARLEAEIDRAAGEGDDIWLAETEIAADQAYDDANRVHRELTALRAR